MDLPTLSLSPQALARHAPCSSAVRTGCAAAASTPLKPERACGDGRSRSLRAQWRSITETVKLPPGLSKLAARSTNRRPGSMDEDEIHRRGNRGAAHKRTRRNPGELFTFRHLRHLRHYDFEAILDRRKVGARLMRLMGLEALGPKPKTARPSAQHRVYPYLLRGVTIDRPSQVWAADITYIPMARGFLYLVGGFAPKRLPAQK